VSPKATAVEAQSVESVQPRPAAELSTPVVRLQSELRQLLHCVTESLYSVTDIDLLKEAVASARAQLKSFRDHGDQDAHRAAYRHSHRPVRGSIAANSLRWRLSVVRSRRVSK